MSRYSPASAELRKVLSKHSIPHGAVADADLPALLDAALNRYSAATTARHCAIRDAAFALSHMPAAGPDPAAALAILQAALAAEP